MMSSEIIPIKVLELSLLESDCLRLGHAPSPSQWLWPGRWHRVWFIYPTLQQELVSIPDKPYGLRGSSPGKMEGLLLKSEAKDAGQEAETTDVSYNWLSNKDV